MGMSEWRKTKLGNVITLKRGYDLPNSSRQIGCVPIVSSSGISDYHNECKVKAPGVITGRYGTIGKVFYVTQDFWPLNTTLYVEDFKGNNPLFISYFLQCIDFQAYAAKSAVPGINRNDLHLAEVIVPDTTIQQKITHILSTYDNLIENNNRRIAILEEMAQKLYREWFVHFRFPGHENVKMVESELGLIPEGWNIGVLSDVAGNHKKSVKKDNREKYKCYIPIDCIPKKSLALSETKSISEAESSLIEFQKNDILMGAMRVYFHKVLCAPCDGLTRSTCFVIRPKDEIYHAYLLMAIFQEQTIEYASTVSVGATMPYVNWDTFAQMQTLIPTSEVVLMYNDVLKPIIQQMHNIFYKNTNLRKTRDLLLPHLISGDIDVSELDIPIKEG